MERLNAELTETLQGIVDMEESGEDVAEHVFEVMYGDKGDERECQQLLDLANLGYVVIRVDGTNTVTEGLTSKGRSYFKDLEDDERRERKRIWSDRRFQIGLSIATLVLSGVISLIVSLVVSFLTQ